MFKILPLLFVLGPVLALVACKDEEKKPAATPPAKVDTPKVDTPKVDGPKVDVPKVDVPKVDVPKVDVPKVDVPKVDATAATKDAQTLLDQVQQYVKDKKWDDAEAALKKLDGMKDKLPGDWAAKIEAARTALNAAKGAGSLPGGGAVPGLPK
jgi:hypothetical protein